MVRVKDGVPDNTHPLNVVDGATGGDVEVVRPPLYEVYMRMAEELAKRSTCARLRVGTVVGTRNHHRSAGILGIRLTVELALGDDVNQ